MLKGAAVIRSLDGTADFSDPLQQGTLELQVLRSNSKAPLELLEGLRGEHCQEQPMVRMGWGSEGLRSGH